jgi:hypothetical protein
MLQHGRKHAALRALYLTAAVALVCGEAQAQFAAPVLKWSRGGCFSSWCQTGWYGSPAVADLDGDGTQEVIWASYDLVVLDGPTGALRARGASPQRAWSSVALADLQGDDGLEIVVGRNGNQVTLYQPVAGGGTLALNAVWTVSPFSSGEVRTLAVEDVDGDGPLEIIVGRASGGATRQVNVLHPDGSVRAGWPARRDGDPGFGWGMYNQNVAVADITGDGIKEIYAPTDTHYITALLPNGNQIGANALYGAGKVWSQVGVHVDQVADLRGYANCGSEHRPNFANSSPAISDLDGDGTPELVVLGDVYDCALGDPDGDLYVTPWILRGDRTRWSNAQVDWTVVPVPPAGSGPLSQDFNVIQNAVLNAVPADLDGDGIQEILYPSYDGRMHAVWLDKTEHGSWPYDVPGTGFRFAGEPAVADLDGDGDAEVIFTSWPQNGGGRIGRLHVLDHLGNALFAADLPAPVGSDWNGGLAAPTLAEIDGDPDLEVIVGTSGSGVVAYDMPNTANARVLWGTGRGNYRRTGVAAAAAGPGISIGDASVAEPSGAPVTLSFTVTLSAAAATPLSVSYVTVPGTATAGDDYETTSGEVVIPAGETTTSIEVQVNGDGAIPIDEFDETFTVRLFAPTLGALVDGNGRGTILDTSPPPALSLGSVAVAEGNAAGSATLTVGLSPRSEKPVSVSFSTEDGSAVAGEDYQPRSGTVAIPPGTTTSLVAVTVLGDRRPEPDETFQVTLSAPVNATLAASVGSVTILNDDTPSARVFVSIGGNDLNLCANVATPCRTLDEGVSQVAHGGEVIVLTSGSYAGATITKSVKINAPSGIVAFSAAPVRVAAGASDVVVLRGLTLKALTPGTGTGVSFQGGAALFVESSVIDGWERGIAFETPGQLFVTHTSVRGCASDAVRIAPQSGTARASISHSRLEGSAGGCGLFLEAGATGTVTSSVLAGNADGVCVSGTGSEASVHGSLVAGSSGAGLLASGGTVRVSSSLVVGNATGLRNTGGLLETRGNSLVRGNAMDVDGAITTIPGQ